MTVLGENGVPSPPFVTRVAPPASRMGPLTAEEIAPLLRTEQVQQYATAVDRESAYEILGARITNGGANDNARAGAPEAKPAAPAPAAPRRTRGGVARRPAIAGRPHDRHAGDARPDGRAARQAPAPPPLPPRAW